MIQIIGLIATIIGVYFGYVAVRDELKNIGKEISEMNSQCGLCNSYGVPDMGCDDTACKHFNKSAKNICPDCRKNGRPAKGCTKPKCYYFTPKPAQPKHCIGCKNYGVPSYGCYVRGCGYYRSDAPRTCNNCRAYGRPQGGCNVKECVNYVPPKKMRPACFSCQLGDTAVSRCPNRSCPNYGNPPRLWRK